MLILVSTCLHLVHSSANSTNTSSLCGPSSSPASGPEFIISVLLNILTACLLGHQYFDKILKDPQLWRRSFRLQRHGTADI